jgi:hypothetical protein
LQINSRYLTHSTQAIPHKALRLMGGVEYVECVGYKCCFISSVQVTATSSFYSSGQSAASNRKKKGFLGFLWFFSVAENYFPDDSD